MLESDHEAEVEPPVVLANTPPRARKTRRAVQVIESDHESEEEPVVVATPPQILFQVNT